MSHVVDYDDYDDYDDDGDERGRRVRGSSLLRYTPLVVVRNELFQSPQAADYRAVTLKGNKKPLLLIASVCFLDPPNELPRHGWEGGGRTGGGGGDTISEREEQDVLSLSLGSPSVSTPQGGSFHKI